MAAECKENNDLTFAVAMTFQPRKNREGIVTIAAPPKLLTQSKGSNQLLRLNWQENARIQWWYIAGVCMVFFLVLYFTHTENSYKPLKVVFANSILSQTSFKLFYPLLYNKHWKSYFCNFLFLFFFTIATQ